MRHTCGLSRPCHRCKIPSEPEEKRKDRSQAMAWTHHRRLQTRHPIQCTTMGAGLWPGHTIEGFKHATRYNAQRWEPGYGLNTPSKASNMPPDTTHNDGSWAMAWTHHRRLQTCHPIRRTTMGAGLWPEHTINGEAETKERREWGSRWDPKVQLT